MTDDIRTPEAVTITVTNRSSEPIALVLEPIGEVYPIDPGQSRGVLYTGDPAPRLSIDLHDREIKIWEEGVGTIELQE